MYFVKLDDNNFFNLDKLSSVERHGQETRLYLDNGMCFAVPESVEDVLSVFGAASIGIAKNAAEGMSDCGGIFSFRELLDRIRNVRSPDGSQTFSEMLFATLETQS